MRQISISMIVACLLVTQAMSMSRLHVPADSGVPLKSTAVAPTFRTDRVLIKVRTSEPRQLGSSAVKAENAARALSALGSGTELSGLKLERSLALPGWSVVRLPAGLSVDQASTMLKKHSEFVRVQPIYKVHTRLASPNDYYYPLSYTDNQYSDSTWPYMWTLQNIDALAGWNIYPNKYYTASTKSSSAIRVAVIDTGIDYTHPDFANAGGTSDDIASGGQIDFANGCSIIGGVMSTGTAAFKDMNLHGTHTSGTLAAAGNNGVGIIGVAYNSVIVPIRVLNSDGSGDDSDLAEAMQYAADKGIPIISMSLGADGYDPVLVEASNYAYYKGCLLIAAGNESSDDPTYLGPSYPAGNSKVLGVSAVDLNDSFASYCGSGNYIGICGPAGDVTEDLLGLSITASSTWSTVPTYPVYFTTDLFGNAMDGYGMEMGTSMATPHVSGLAALYADYKGYSVNTIGGNLAIWRAIQRGADDVSGTGDYTPDFGYGRINVYQTLLDMNARNETTGSLCGQLLFGGDPVQNCTVKVTPMGGGQSVTTTTLADGTWRIPDLPAGLYTVTGKAYGFPNTYTNVPVVAGCDTPGVDIYVAFSQAQQPFTTAPNSPTVFGISYTGSGQTLQSAWWAQDYNCGVVDYQVAIGTSSGSTNVMSWTDVGWNTSGSFNITSAGGKPCYLSVKAINGVGITSPITINGPGTTVSGKLILQNYVASITQVPITVQLRQHGSSTTIRTVNLASDTSYTLSSVTSGTYDFAFKASHWLQRVVSNVVIGSQPVQLPVVTLLNGDINGDNFVEDQDYSLLGLAWYTAVGDAKYNVNADLNGDGFVEDQDYSIMGLNWYTSGDP
jgi:subtilisin family serine protease